jgi:hypothetical protein
VWIGVWVCGLLLYSRVEAFPVGLSLDAVLLVALSLDVINPCYPRCVGTVVALCYYWLLFVSRHWLSVYLFAVGRYGGFGFQLFLEWFCGNDGGGGCCIFRIVSKTLLGVNLWSSLRWLLRDASLWM